jgi:hypothetical protein
MGSAYQGFFSDCAFLCFPFVARPGGSTPYLRQAVRTLAVTHAKYQRKVRLGGNNEASPAKPLEQEKITI